METTSELQAAISWLSDRPEVSEQARRSAGVAGKAFPDAVAEDPSRMLKAVKAVAIEAIHLDAPEGVVEGLMQPIRRMSAGLNNLYTVDYTVRKLAEMQGLRDRHELEPALMAARDQAPDDTNRARLDAMLEILPVADRAMLLEEGGLGIHVGPLTHPLDCWPACAVSCVICGVIGGGGFGLPGAAVGCAFCCVASCLLSS